MVKKIYDNEFPIEFAKGVHRKASDLFKAHETKQYAKLTDVNLSSTIDSFIETAGLVNEIRGSADKRTEWLRETYPIVEVVPPTGIPLDLQIAGGGKRVHMESELGGAQAVAKDRKKLTVNDTPADASVMFWRVKSRSNLGKGFDDIRRGSIGRDGVFIGVEEYLPKALPVSETVAHVKAFRNGEAIFDSNIVAESGSEEYLYKDEFFEV